MLWCAHFSSVGLSKAFLTNDPEEGCARVTDDISNAMELLIPSKTVTRKTEDKVWFDDRCRKAAIRKRPLFRQLKKKNTPENKQKFFSNKASL